MVPLTPEQKEILRKKLKEKRGEIELTPELLDLESEIDEERDRDKSAEAYSRLIQSGGGIIEPSQPIEYAKLIDPEEPTKYTEDITLPKIASRKDATLGKAKDISALVRQRVLDRRAEIERETPTSKELFPDAQTGGSEISKATERLDFLRNQESKDFLEKEDLNAYNVAKPRLKTLKANLDGLKKTDFKKRDSLNRKIGATEILMKNLMKKGEVTRLQSMNKIRDYVKGENLTRGKFTEYGLAREKAIEEANKKLFSEASETPTKEEVSFFEAVGSKFIDPKTGKEYYSDDQKKIIEGMEDSKKDEAEKAITEKLADWKKKLKEMFPPEESAQMINAILRGVSKVAQGGSREGTSVKEDLSLYDDFSDRIAGVGKYEDKSKKKKGGVLQQNTLKFLAEGEYIPGQIDRLVASFDLPAVSGSGVTWRQMMGPIKGGWKALAAKIPGGLGQLTDAGKAGALFESSFGPVRQAFGRYMEGGVLRKEDEEKYKTYFPKLSDSQEVADNKMNQIKLLLVAKQDQLLDIFEAQGYNMAGFDQKKKDTTSYLNKYLEAGEKIVLDKDNNPIVFDASGKEVGNALDRVEKKNKEVTDLSNSLLNE